MITITIKGIPKDTHRELKKRAAAHRRSLNSEVIFLLESSVGDSLTNMGQNISGSRRLIRKMVKKK
jgi:plasmid stability protein